ncbi:8501_t:CDS:2 [Entrophospora sp. SA101]|nr:11745_t:CDS:2 [Entrophospora sp. SA101]CAJ0893294.1 17235_t:CDS:2 [Entrophospora sp. SA101]CAJ0905414.1 8501_t:CDS:2 [Entrophospora sp. SA101]
MIKAQQYINKEYPKSNRNKVTKLDISNKGLEGKLVLELKEFPNLEELDCSNNLLTEITFTNPHKRTTRSSSRLAELEELSIANNKFIGSLESLKNMTKLKRLDISDTDINNGLEYLPESLEEINCSSGMKKDAKVQNIIQKLNDYRNNEIEEVKSIISRLGKNAVVVVNEYYAEKNRLTPLHVATARNYFEIVKLLLEAGADPNVKDSKGNTPLHFAAEKNRLDILKTLVENKNSEIKGNIDATNEYAIYDELLSKVVTSGDSYVLVKPTSSIEPRINGTSKQHKYLDTLARLLTSTKDICVAVCYDENSEQLLVANNRRQADYAEIYLDKLREFIKEFSNDKYEDLLTLSVFQLKDLIEKQQMGAVIQAIEESSEYEKFNKFKEKIEIYENKSDLFLIKEYAKELFSEINQLREKKEMTRANEFWNYLAPLEDANIIAQAISQGDLEYKIVKAIKEKSVVCIEGEENVHAEMKIINRLRQNSPKKKTLVYIGISKFSCLVCQSTIDTINRRSNFSSEGYEFAIRGTHGGTYPEWIEPDLSSSERRELISRLERIKGGEYPLKVRESTSTISQKLKIDFEENDVLADSLSRRIEILEKIDEMKRLFTEKKSVEESELDCLLRVIKKGIDCLKKEEESSVKKRDLPQEQKEQTFPSFLSLKKTKVQVDLQEPEFYAYLRDELNLTPEQILNDNSISLTDLREQFNEYKQKQEQQAQILNKEPYGTPSPSKK